MKRALQFLKTAVYGRNKREILHKLLKMKTRSACKVILYKERGGAGKESVKLKCNSVKEKWKSEHPKS